MTYYHGGKKRLGNSISDILLYILNTNDKIIGYCEPFCGMLGVYKYILNKFPKIKFIAGDQNKSLIMMWKSLQKGWFPPKSTSKKNFLKLKYNCESSAEKGFIGHHYGFGGKYFQGYKNRITKNTIDKLKILTSIPNFKKIKFYSNNYTKISSLENYIIYCDPPYSIYSSYYNDCNELQKFNHDDFWIWVRYMSKHNYVIVSEYTAPKDFIKIKINDCVVSYGNNKSKKNTEYVFIHKSLIK